MKAPSILSLAGLLLASALGTHSVCAQPTFTTYGIQGNHTNNVFYLSASSPTVDGPYVEMINNSSSDANRAGSIGYIAGYNASNLAGISHSFYSRTSGGGWISHLRILQNGQVQIGQVTPTGSYGNYKLAVDGKLVAKSVYVTSPANWADFVFESSYKRLTLPALEQYLQLNKHLPSMPSAKEVEANGYGVGEMDAKLLQSVEELTLYVIELSKTNEKLAARVAELERQRVTIK